MTRAALEGAEERRHVTDAYHAQSKAILARDAGAETSNAVAKLNRDRAKRDSKWREWDGLICTDEFGAFLKNRRLLVREVWQSLPCDIGAEMAVIGAVLIDGDSIGQVDALRVRHFSARPCIIAFRAIRSLHGDGQPIDTVTVASQIKQQRQFDSDTTKFLSDCVSLCPGSANIAAYAKAVMIAARLRALFLLGETLSKNALEPEADYRKTINTMRRALDAIEERGIVNLTEIFNDTK